MGLSVHLWAWIWSRARWQQPLRTWPPQSTLLMHLMVIIDRRNGGIERVQSRQAETEEHWEGVWPEQRFTFHCKNTRAWVFFWEKWQIFWGMSTSRKAHTGSTTQDYTQYALIFPMQTHKSTHKLKLKEVGLLIKEGPDHLLWLFMSMGDQ